MDRVWKGMLLQNIFQMDGGGGEEAEGEKETEGQNPLLWHTLKLDSNSSGLPDKEGEGVQLVNNGD